MPVENYIYLIAQDLKSFINLVDQYIRVLYITKLLIHVSSFNDSCKDFNDYMVFNSTRSIDSTMFY